MKEIPLTLGYTAIVDDFNYERVIARGKWHAALSKRKDGSIVTVYARRYVGTVDGKNVTERMHRFILGVTDDEIEIDHRDHNGLHNWVGNLRVCKSKKDNRRNRRVRWDSIIGLKGINRHHRSRKWMVRLMLDGKSSVIGYSLSLREAVEMYNKAAIKAFGEFAEINNMSDPVVQKLINNPPPRVVEVKGVSGFRGVSFRHGKYQARIGVDRKLLHLGSFDSLEEAVRARQAATQKYHDGVEFR